jgi:hypothetical protein
VSIGPVELLIILVLVGIWLWALVDCLQREPAGTTKLLWILMIVFAPPGALLYLLLHRPQRMMESSR